MKYKHIPAFLHNFTDSFMSLVNYSGDGYAADAMALFLASSHEKSLVVHWLPELKTVPDRLPERVGDVLGRYARWIPVLSKSMRIDHARLAAMHTNFAIEGGLLRADSLAVDDRGTSFHAPPKFWDYGAEGAGI
jgi:hypothetical protein